MSCLAPQDNRFRLSIWLLCLLIFCNWLLGCGPIARRAALNDRLNKAEEDAGKQRASMIEKAKEEEGHCGLPMAINPKTLVIRQPGKSAKTAGLFAGDKLLAVDGKVVANYGEYKSVIKSLRYPQTVPLLVLRDKSQVEVECSCLNPSEPIRQMANAFGEASKGNWHEAYSQVKRLESIAGPRSFLTAAQILFYFNYLSSEGKQIDKDLTLPYLIYDASLQKIDEESYSLEALKEVRADIAKNCDLLAKLKYARLGDEVQAEYEKALHEASLPPAPLPKEIAQTPPSQKRIEASFSTGTGFAVTPDGRVMTALHVVQGASTIKLYFANGMVERAIVDQSLPSVDIAILRTNKPAPAYLPLAPMRSAKVGQKVFTVGFPVPQLLGQEPKYADGSISSLSGLGNNAAFMQITVPLQPGNSGGPLVNENGEVLGIVSCTVAIKSFVENAGTLPQNVNWAAKVDYAYPLFEPVLAGVGQPFSHDKIVEKVQRAVCLIVAQK